MKKLVNEDFNTGLENVNLDESIFEEEFSEEDLEGDLEADVNDDEDIEPEEAPEEEVIKAIRNELISPEFNRRSVAFTDKKSGESVEGVPMAQIGNEAFLFKVDGNLRKYRIENIKLEE